ncbi:DNA polymerase III subunit beta [Helcobacillus massiliensis]|uniref:DNA polymerase III subunit beta n=1 Tax=Helcobacillus massiliensis TaxID=521392 RepID=UPI002556398F|nr:DNA polymerase III subunit beta [Helcobacillus massiliensis]MDK7741350.1 DNA polymerase III subunit beta [Helcobacillus massiliensis]WOO92799.1 DNA polymerase III subunit beta [Helcobacillus massiliensis]
MRFHLDRDVLNEAVSWATRTLPTRPAMPILQGVKIVADTTGELKLSTFDYEVSAHITLPAEVDEAGEVLVQGRMLSEIVRALPNKPVSFQLEGTKVEIRCGSSRFTLAVLPIGDYPALPELPPVVGTIDSSLFAQAISQVSIAASKDDVVPLLTGVRIEIDGEKVAMMATDRFRLAMREFTWNPSDPSAEMSAIVRSRTLTEVARSLGSGSVEIALNTGEQSSIIGFESAGRRTTSTLVDGDYPPVRRLFPDNTNYSMTVATQPLIEAVKRVSLVAERNTPVRLTFSEGQVALEAGAGDDAQASEVIEAQVEGGELVVGYNSGFLLEGLGAFTTDFVQFKMPDSIKPSVIRGQESQDADADDSYRYLLMPMRI